MAIQFFYDRVKYRIRNSTGLKDLLKEVIRQNVKKPGDLKYILTDDETIKEINGIFLNHNYYTDVISFDYSVKEIVSGEIYISIDTVRYNSINYKVSLRKELMRVIIHGTLHLCGFDDKTESQRKVMRKEEDRWLMKLEEKK